MIFIFIDKPHYLELENISNTLSSSPVPSLLPIRKQGEWTCLKCLCQHLDGKNKSVISLGNGNHRTKIIQVIK